MVTYANVECIGPAIARQAADHPDRVAILGVGRSPATYAALSDHIRAVGGALRARGVAPTDRVALLVENGPEAATAFLGIASAATCAPLNPQYRETELRFYLEDLQARAVVVSSTLETPARDVARDLGLEVLELSVPEGRPAGVFDLDAVVEDHLVLANDGNAVALVLHTSGTTARPKIVPLLHRHLLASADNVLVTLGLRESDRCLNVMPLFHIHGIVAALLATLRAGGSVACAPGFHQVHFFEWLRSLEPTWTTAVPTMYQSLLERLRRDSDLARGHGLRFARSSSAALPVTVLEGLEDALGVPVIEAYGMTEAAHQMASNPLPPGERRPGSVGLPAGPEIAVLDVDGRILPSGEIGEVAIRGANVFDGYERNPAANEAAFVNGWFRTGDQGRLDEDGYLVLLGRLKEIINRAGEKISPLEIDDVLLRHPSVQQAATFAVADPRLGEEVAAVVVPRPGLSVEPFELQDFVAQTVAPFKVPRRIVIAEEIPKGPTGKVQRVALAEQLGLENTVRSRADHAGDGFLEEGLRAIWSDVLGIPEISEEDDFFALGGDSILGAEAVARTRDLVGNPDLPLVSIVRAPTPRNMAREVLRQFGWATALVVPIQSGDPAARPVFVVPGVDGEVVCFVPLARRLGVDTPVFGLRAPGLDDEASPPTDVESLADAYLDAMRDVQPEGPYVFVSYCMGAAIAIELMHRLEARRETMALVAIDPRLQRPHGLRYSAWLLRRRARQRRLRGALRRRLGASPSTGERVARSAVWAALEVARDSYRPRPVSGLVAVLLSEDFERFDMPDWYLSHVFPRTAFSANVPGAHVDLFRTPVVDTLHVAVSAALARLEHV